MAKLKSAYTGVSSRKTAQTEAILGETQVENNAGGFVYELTPLKAFERFLILGSEGGTYYVGEHKLTRENTVNAIAVIESDGIKAVDLIVAISEGGRAPKNEAAIFALALAASSKSQLTRAYALGMLPRVCRIPTHLFHFITYVKQFRGLGRGLKTALGNWYQKLDVEKLAYEVVKYQNRDGWSNTDILRLSHPKTFDATRNLVYKWIVDGWSDVHVGSDIPGIISAFETCKTAPNAAAVVKLIENYNLSREMLPTEALTYPEVWAAMLPKMPLTAMIRNLGNMSKVGLVTPLSEAAKQVVAKLSDREAIKKAKVHPIALLIAMRTYSQGHGNLGKGAWNPVTSVVDALDEAFYLAFDALEPTGKTLLFGLDVSGSMGSPCGGLPISCAEGAAAMALACAKTETNYHIMGFTAGSGRYMSMGMGWSLDGFVDLGISPKMRLNDALAKTRYANFGSTDCSLPMIWALKNKVKVDGIIVITDNETYAGLMHPSQALKEYRQAMGVDAKEVVVGMTATKFTIADPTDPRTLDVVGFDTATPQIITEFIK